MSFVNCKPAYTFYLNTPDWTHTYSGQEEIWEYMKKVTTKYDLYPFIKFNSQIKTLAWDEKIRKWRAVIYNKLTKKEQELLFDIV